MKFWLGFMMLILAACGSGEKRDFPSSKPGSGSQPSQDSNCPFSYSPLPLLRDGVTPISHPDLLPKGRYSFLSSEYFLREESQPEKFKAHYAEELRSGSILIRKVCADKTPKEDIFEQPYPSLEQINNLSTGATYVPVRVLFQGQEGQIKFSKLPRAAPVSGSILSMLQEWDQWKIYQTGLDSFEIRVTSLEIESGFSFRKFLVIRLRISPE